MKMGAKTIIDRNEFLQDPIKPMDKALYSSAVDTVGGDILAKTLTMVSNHGVVSCCGNVAGASFTSSVFPFILRGIQLCGIDSAESSIELKKELWDLLSDSWSLDLTNQTKIVDLNEIDKEIEKILRGNQIGRVVIKHGE
jgi:NADPH:quinone reductase-like Zn-dependent oxidoreductase